MRLTLWHWTDENTARQIFGPKRFRPELNRDIIFGTGTYFVPQGRRWPNGGDFVVECVVRISEGELKRSFSGRQASGMEGKNVQWYLNEQGIKASRNTSAGNSPMNLSIQRHFLENGVKGIRFEEMSGLPVFAIYDQDCIVEFVRIYAPSPEEIEDLF